MRRREPNGYAYTRSGRQSDADALRVRCRVTVLMQRACDAVHRACSPHMPLAVQLQLLSVLQVRCLRLGLCSPLTSEGITGSGDGSASFYSGESQIRTYAQGNGDLNYAVIFHRKLVLVYSFHHFSR